MRILLMFTLSCGFAAPGTWSGFLVDGDCYGNLERNVSPKDTSTDVDRDRDSEVRYCHPTARTKSFTLVDRNGQSHKLDPAANSRAAEIARKAPKDAPIHATVSGEERNKRITVDSIVASQ